MSEQDRSNETMAGPAAGTPPVADAMIGRNVGRKFILEKLLGEGAMGAVYRARQTALEKVVAIKVMHGELARDVMFAGRFHREAKAASRLDHPNSIRIIDYGQDDDGLLYIAMEYLDGRDLAHLLTEQWPFSTSRMVDLLGQALGAIAVAHDLGITHRDLKPENIMVLRRTTDEGAEIDVVKVCDFGIAKLVEAGDDVPLSENHARVSRAKLTTAGLVIGTPAYMSPEQGRGEVIDARSDLYSVGVILYQMLTGELPFDAPSAVGVLLKHQTEEPRPPSTLRPVDPRLEAVCLKAMRKAPSDRYQTARELRAALRGVTDGATSGSDVSAGDRSPISTAAPSSTTAVPVQAGSAPEVAMARTELQLEAVTTGSTTAVAAGAAPPASKRRWPLVAGGLTAAALIAVVVARPSLHPMSAVPQPAPAPSGLVASASPLTVTDPPLAVPTGHTAEPPEVAPPPRDVMTSHHGHAVVQKPVPPASNPPATAATLAAATPPVPEPPPAPPPPVITPVVAAPPPPPVAAPPPAFDPARATVAIGSASNVVGTGAAEINGMMRHVAEDVTGCYRSALPSMTGPRDGTGTIHVEIDETSRVTDVRVSGALRDAIGPCVRRAIMGQKVAGDVTGNAGADVPVVFRPL